MDGIIKQGIEAIKREFDTGVAEGKNILVTGGAGFLGSWICDVLVESKANVICLDNFSSGLKENISHLLGRKNFKFVQHDITQPIFFNEEIDIVMHLASRASPFEFEKYPIQILKANTLGIWVALGIAKKHEAEFLYTSTSEIYGDAKEIPTTEEYRGNVNPIGPRSCYDEAKRCGESYVIAYRMQHGLDTRIARIFNTYGPRMRAEGIYGRVVPRFVEQALSNKQITVFGDGTQTRSFCYVTDQVEGLLKLAFSERAEGEVVNIGSEGEITILELAKLIKELTKSSSEIEFHPLPKDDPVRRKPDIRKAKKLLGWKPKVKLEEGLRMMIEWFKEKER
ncbi:MAG: UDP-glucuronic acid decarboxylase family protein [Candidatus Methanospirareceae archaeon]